MSNKCPLFNLHACNVNYHNQLNNKDISGFANLGFLIYKLVILILEFRSFNLTLQTALYEDSENIDA